MTHYRHKRYAIQMLGREDAFCGEGRYWHQVNFDAALLYRSKAAAEKRCERLNKTYFRHQERPDLPFAGVVEVEVSCPMSTGVMSANVWWEA
jgi:hypothetical protein